MTTSEQYSHRTDIRLVEFGDVEGPSTELRVVGVHLKEVFGEEHRFLTAHTGRYFQFSVVFIR